MSKLSFAVSCFIFQRGTYNYFPSSFLICVAILDCFDENVEWRQNETKRSCEGGVGEETGVGVGWEVGVGVGVGRGAGREGGGN